MFKFPKEQKFLSLSLIDFGRDILFNTSYEIRKNSRRSVNIYVLITGNEPGKDISQRSCESLFQNSMDRFTWICHLTTLLNTSSDLDYLRNISAPGLHCPQLLKLYHYSVDRYFCSLVCLFAFLMSLAVILNCLIWD